MAKSSTPRKKKSKKKLSRRSAGDRNKLMQSLRSYVRTHSPKLLEDPNITSVGIGYKHVEGSSTPQLAIQFTVETKVAPEQIKSLGSRPIPKTIDVAGVQVPTEVIERSYKPSYRRVELQVKDQRKTRADVMQPGMSIGA